MSRMYKIIKGEVKYPIACTSGIWLEPIGSPGVLIPVEERLAQSWMKNGMIGRALVREDLDFEILDRKIVAALDEKSALICDKGEISGGRKCFDEWFISLMDGTKHKSTDLKPVPMAEALSTPAKLEERAWHDLRSQFEDMYYSGDMTSTDIVEWFKKRTKLKTNF